MPSDNNLLNDQVLPSRKPKASPDNSAALSHPLVEIGSKLFEEVEIRLEARMGQAAMSVAELLKLKIGSTVALDLRLDEPVTLYVNGAPVARGEIVAVDHHFGVRITDIAAVENS